MTHTLHTPGPWSLDPNSDGTILADCDGLFVAETETEDRPAKECEANAHVILAVFDLLHALEELVARDRAEARECGFADDEMSWLEDADRAIAKAKGGAP